jgi:hypothetical protein
MYSEFQEQLSLVESGPAKAQIGIDQLVVDVYESAQLEQKDKMVAQLVGKVFESAPLEDQSRILEHLLRPLGVLSLLTVANGVFAKIRLKSGWTSTQIPIEDAKGVQPGAVTALVDYVQQVSIQTVDSLAQLLISQPTLMGSAAAVVLVSVLMKRSHFRRAEDFLVH